MKKFCLFLFLSLVFVLSLSITAAQDSYTVKTRTARVRAEPNTTSRVLATLRFNAELDVIEAVEGARVSGSTVWYHIQLRNRTGYIHSSLVEAPASGGVVVSTSGSGGSAQGNGSSGGAQPTVEPISTPIPDAPPSFVPNCSGDVYNCSDLSRSQINAYAATCVGDPSRLDRDKDGLYCE